MGDPVERMQRLLEIARLPRPFEPVEDESQLERASLRQEFAAPDPLPEQVTLDRVALREKRIVFREDIGPAASAYRMLRTQVLQRARAHDMTTIGVVSAVNGEGKTLTAINLALSIAAEPNQFVALIDLDLRRPAVAQTLGLKLDRGLDSWFASSSPVERVCYGIEGIDRMLVLPTLMPVPGSSETLAGSGVKRLLSELKARDQSLLRILDLPPALLSDDVLMLSPLLDGVVIVTSEARTRRDDVVRVLELLSNTHVVGTVLNRSSESEQRAY